MAGKPELFETEPKIESHDDRVLVEIRAPDDSRGMFTVAWFDNGLIVRMEDFNSRRKAESAFKS